MGQEIKIGVLRHYKIKSIELTCQKGDYTLFEGEKELLYLKEGDKVNFKSVNGLVSFYYNGLNHTGKLFQLIPIDTAQIVRLKCVQPNVKFRSYYDAIQIKANSSLLTVINKVDMEHYLGGVIESEGGGGKHIEYYKVQALMSRTYAYKNLKRHMKDGFSLCDEVHCQAYHNRLIYTPDIHKAVIATKGEVLVDSQNRLIGSYFSANCGGQTCDASYIWKSSLPFLESFRDTFCINTKQALWTKKISKDAWFSYIEKKCGQTIFKMYNIENLVNEFSQDYRKAFYIHPSLGIPLRDLRFKFKLKSTFFTTKIEGDYVIVSGRGFGHGVGLCQEGAMGMANNGYNYRQIALFYFENVSVVNRLRKIYFEDFEEESILIH